METGMQKEFNEKLGKGYQCMSKLMINTMTLNAETFNNLAKNANLFEDISHMRKPEDLLAAHIKLTNQAVFESARYAQKAMQIGIEAFSDMGKEFGEGFQMPGVPNASTRKESSQR